MDADEMREVAIGAWLAGARAVHDEWASADEGQRFYLSRDEQPDFTEAAHDYAANLDPTASDSTQSPSEQGKVAYGDCAKIALKVSTPGPCRNAGFACPETGVRDCALEMRGEVCLCDLQIELGDAIAAAIRAEALRYSPPTNDGETK